MMARTTITLPFDLRMRMVAVKDRVKWSSVAAAAFEVKLKELAEQSVKPQCDMRDECKNPVTHVGDKGWIYCAEHARGRQGWERTRQMRKWELDILKTGGQLPKYDRITKREAKIMEVQS